MARPLLAALGLLRGGIHDQPQVPWQLLAGLPKDFPLPPPYSMQPI
ncbi:MAG: hypothetical protein JF586_03650 [Burkholderiales bacterium]|nr:hypothetical protein [Burkholderiales bacterium]